ncbi:MAG: zinc-binding dehydrogenase, partial [Blastocatellia bacterium]
DYSREDFTKGTQRYDLIFDLVANHSLLACKRVMKPKGIYIGAGMIGLGESITRILVHMIAIIVLSRLVSQNFVTFMAKINKEDLAVLGELMATGKVTPVIDRCYSLSEVSEAIGYLEGKHARGKIVISLKSNNDN